MSKALVLGATGPNSFGRHLTMHFLQNQITPILVGRTANNISMEPGIGDRCYFVQADLTHFDIGSRIILQCGDLSEIKYLVIAGGGPHLKGSIADHSLTEVNQVLRSIVLGPLDLLRNFHQNTSHPYHLVTIASTSAIKRRKDETVYASAQTARMQIALNFHYELMQREGSKNTIVCPGGMKTDLWKDEVNPYFMDPAEVAKIVWETMTEQSENTKTELLINRGVFGTPLPKRTRF